jgi:hypothetical protein
LHTLEKYLILRAQSPKEFLLYTVFFYFEMRSHYMAQARLELEILLPQPPEYWDYRCVPSYPAYTVILK